MRLNEINNNKFDQQKLQLQIYQNEIEQINNPILCACLVGNIKTLDLLLKTQNFCCYDMYFGKNNFNPLLICSTWTNDDESSEMVQMIMSSINACHKERHYNETFFEINTLEKYNYKPCFNCICNNSKYINVNQNMCDYENINNNYDNDSNMSNSDSDSDSESDSDSDNDSDSDSDSNYSDSDIVLNENNNKDSEIPSPLTTTMNKTNEKEKEEVIKRGSVKRNYNYHNNYNSLYKNNNTCQYLSFLYGVPISLLKK